MDMVRQAYTEGFAEACKKAGMEPKEVFIKQAQWFTRLMSMLGRGVSRPVAWGARTLGGEELEKGVGGYGARLSKLNRSREAAIMKEHDARLEEINQDPMYSTLGKYTAGVGGGLGLAGAGAYGLSGRGDKPRPEDYDRGYADYMRSLMA
jgi:hypothetical protein